MPEGETGQTQSQTQSRNQRSNRGGSRGGHRRGRGGRGRGGSGNATARGGGNTSAQQDAPASAPTAQSQPETAPESSGASRGRRNRRGRGRAARGGDTPVSTHTGPQRRFGGHLTSSGPVEAEASTSQLSGQAPEFVPGQTAVSIRTGSQVTAGNETRSRVHTPLPNQSNSQPHTADHAEPRLRLRRRRRRPKKDTPEGPKAPKSTAAELWQRIHEDIDNLNYECNICTDEVTRKCTVWSCSICSGVCHLECVKEWYDTTSEDIKTGSGEITWRCPACNSKVYEIPVAYFCWCKKELEPSQLSSMLPPHSCGQTCAKPRTTCEHPCPLQCHAGPCPPCDVQNPQEPCFCGKNSSLTRCRDTAGTNGWSCNEACGDLLPCGEHTCPELCHPEFCKPCTVKVSTSCFCGKTENEMLCFERFEGEGPQDSYGSKNNEWFTGFFDCGKICGRAYDCGVHTCKMTCHPQDEEPAHCPFSPDVVDTCPCGKTSLEELLDHPRQTCEDVIPLCTKPCDKPLSCGHRCSYACHDGDCSPCMQYIDVNCRCGRVTNQTLCPEGEISQPLCFKVCQAVKNCSRHRCTERCCPGEKKAQLRVAQQKKLRRALETLPVEDEHICIEVCGRSLSCGKHTCQQICHRGPCEKCPEAIWEEISCACGDTVLEPGYPCGTRPPYCASSCKRERECAHPIDEHKCHPDDVECTPCTYLTTKDCNCGKRSVKYVPCHLQRPHCGESCGRTLKCGHTCKKICHRPEDCEEENKDHQTCSQLCGKMKLNCDHFCTSLCHGSTPCNESTPCQAKKLITCPCGNVKQEVKCQASVNNAHPDRTLKCVDECARLERNRRLAEALNIDPETHTNDHIPYSEETLKLYKELPAAWTEKKEREFRVFCQDEQMARRRYEPMPNRVRQFLHLLAEDFGLQSESQDFGEHRHVVVWKGDATGVPPFKVLDPPSKTLGQCIAIRAKQKAEASVVAALRPVSPQSPDAEAFNGFVLTTPRFGITNDEITADLREAFETVPSFAFKVEYRHNTDTSDEVLITATVLFSAFLTPAPVEKMLTDLKPRIEKIVKQRELAQGILLCHINSEGTITRREKGKGKPSPHDWSSVVSKAARTPAVSATEEKPTGRRLLGLKKKKPEPEGKMWQTLQGDVEC